MIEQTNDAESWARFYRANAQGPRNWFNGEGWRGGLKEEERSTRRERSFERGTKRGRAVSKIIGTLSGSLRVRSETIIWGRRGQK